MHLTVFITKYYYLYVYYTVEMLPQHVTSLVQTCDIMLHEYYCIGVCKRIIVAYFKHICSLHSARLLTAIIGF